MRISMDELNDISVSAVELVKNKVKQRRNIELTDKELDIVDESLSKAFAKIFPDADYTNYN